MESRVWDQGLWNGKKSEERTDLPLIKDFLTRGQSGEWGVRKVVFITEKKLFLLETSEFKVFVSKNYNPEEFKWLYSWDLANYLYMVEIDNGYWRLSRCRATQKYDRDDTLKCIIYTAPPEIDDSLAGEKITISPQIDDIPF